MKHIRYVKGLSQLTDYMPTILTKMYIDALFFVLCRHHKNMPTSFSFYVDIFKKYVDIKRKRCRLISLFAEILSWHYYLGK